MKTKTWFGIALAVAMPVLSGHPQAPAPQPGPTPTAPTQPQAGPPTAPPNLSPTAAEVVRLAESGVGEDVLLAYIHNSQPQFNIGAEDILYLKDVGISSAVLTAMLNHDIEVRGQMQQPAPVFAQQPESNPSSPQVVAPAPSAPTAPPPQTAPPTTVVSAPPAAAPAAPAPVYVANPPPDVSYFYADLSPYGTWIDLEGVGWCWQPRVVVINHAWRPYCDGGNWVYSDAGWYWQSTYSWGWAAFHYGRWQLHPRCGWVWMPDRVWGPAWVTWRTTGSYCGWAPLPPHATFDVHLGYCYNGVQVGVGFDFGLHSDNFTFIAVGNFGAHNLSQCRLPPTQVNNIYHQTTVINNYVVNNNVIVNRGLPVEHVSAATHTQFPKMAIREAPPVRGGVVAAQSARGVIYRPQLAAPAKPVTMVAQRIDQRHPVVQHPPITPLRTPTRSVYSSSSSAPGVGSRTPPTALRTTTAGQVGRSPGAVPQNPSVSRAQSTTLNSATSRSAGQAGALDSQRSSTQKSYPQQSVPYGSTFRPAQAPSPNAYSESGRNPYSSGQAGSGDQSKTGRSYNQQTRNPKSYNYQGKEARPAPSKAQSNPQSSQPKQTNPER